MVDESIPSTPKVRQVLAHVFLLQDVLQIPALSAGVWYVAIDFQLYSLTVLLLFVAGRLGRTDCWARFLGALFVSGAAVLSLFVFNCDPAWDFIAIYHFAAYAMGLVCYWLIKDQRLPYFWLGVAVLVVSPAKFNKISAAPNAIFG